MKLIALELHQDNIVTAALDCWTQNRALPARRYRLEKGSPGEFAGGLEHAGIVLIEPMFNRFARVMNRTSTRRICAATGPINWTAESC